MEKSEEEHLTGQQASRITYTLESSLDSVNKVEETAEQMAKKAGIDEDEVFRVAMAVREAAVNAVLHGNSYDPEKRITASFENTGESLVIRIYRPGKGAGSGHAARSPGSGESSARLRPRHLPHSIVHG